MTRAVASLATFLLVVATSLGAQAAPRVTRLGAAKSYGPGILQATLSQVRFEITKDAFVIVLQLDQNGGISPMFPTDSEPPLRPSGVHTLTTPKPAVLAGDAARYEDPVLSTAAELARGGRSVRPPAAGMPDTASIVAYWLVIVSDVATSGPELRAQLEAMELNFRSVEAELRALPAALVGKRTKAWGAYWAPVF